MSEKIVPKFSESKTTDSVPTGQEIYEKRKYYYDFYAGLRDELEEYGKTVKK